ncbi:hypothetical protein ACHFJ0_07740 [Paracoccus sp. NGMCC 1.201697]|uniref:Uncharacterized protein n=1 Tax=Paracoccus broussonetiae subsp. drimophilus TaxID=3373869 RepID=A0ABW7LIH0_9RHOB
MPALFLSIAIAALAAVLALLIGVSPLRALGVYSLTGVVTLFLCAVLRAMVHTLRPRRHQT